NKAKQNIFSKILDVIAGCMAPVIPALIGAAMIKVLLIVLPMIDLLNETSQTYQLLTVIGDGAFFYACINRDVSCEEVWNKSILCSKYRFNLITSRFYIFHERRK